MYLYASSKSINNTCCALPPKVAMDLMPGLTLWNWNLEIYGTLVLEGCELCGLSSCC
jgi:hypothetical protein